MEQCHNVGVKEETLLSDLLNYTMYNYLAGEDNTLTVRHLILSLSLSLSLSFSHAHTLLFVQGTPPKIPAQPLETPNHIIIVGSFIAVRFVNYSTVKITLAIKKQHTRPEQELGKQCKAAAKI